MKTYKVWVRVGMEVLIDTTRPIGPKEIVKETKKRLESLKLPKGISLSGDTYIPDEPECIWDVHRDEPVDADNVDLNIF